MALCTPLDPSGAAWTRGRPGAPVVARAAALARRSLAALQARRALPNRRDAAGGPGAAGRPLQHVGAAVLASPWCPRATWPHSGAGITRAGQRAAAVLTGAWGRGRSMCWARGRPGRRPRWRPHSRPRSPTLTRGCACAERRCRRPTARCCPRPRPRPRRCAAGLSRRAAAAPRPTPRRAAARRPCCTPFPPVRRRPAARRRLLARLPFAAWCPVMAASAGGSLRDSPCAQAP